MEATRRVRPRGSPFSENRSRVDPRRSALSPTPRVSCASCSSPTSGPMRSVPARHLCAEQADSIADLGVDVSVLAIRGYAGAVEYPRAVRRALRLRRGNSFDVVHGHHGYGGFVGRPAVTWFAGDLVHRYRPEQEVVTDGRVQRKSVVEAALFRRLALVSAATITKLAAMESLLPAPARERNTVIPNGVDLGRLRRSRIDARRQLGWSEHEKAVMYVGDPTSRGRAATSLSPRWPSSPASNRLDTAHRVAGRCRRRCRCG